MLLIQFGGWNMRITVRFLKKAMHKVDIYLHQPAAVGDLPPR